MSVVRQDLREIRDLWDRRVSWEKLAVRDLGETEGNRDQLDHRGFQVLLVPGDQEEIPAR